MANKAVEIQICVFTGTSKTKAFAFDTAGAIIGINFDQLTEYEVAAYNAAELAVAKLSAPGVKTFVWICPYDYDNNVVTIEQQGFGENLPAILITAYYADQNKKQYALKNTLGGFKMFTQDEVYKYVRALYQNDFESGSESIVCTMFPQLCNIGGYLWLAAAVLATWKAIEAPDNRPGLKVGYTGASILAWDAFAKGGGLKKLFGDKGIGKIR